MCLICDIQLSYACIWIYKYIRYINFLLWWRPESQLNYNVYSQNKNQQHPAKEQKNYMGGEQKYEKKSVSREWANKISHDFPKNVGIFANADHE